MSLPIYFLLLAVGLAVLIWSADALIRASVSLSRYLKLPSSVIGLTLIALGTSLPEIAVSGFASWNGQTELAIGNILGSNISNIALILGIITCLSPLAYGRECRTIDLPMLIGLSTLALWVIVDRVLNWIDGVLLVVAFALYMVVLVRTLPLREDIQTEVAQRPLWQESGILLLTLALITAGSETVVYAASNIATDMGISQAVIGATIVAVGSSLPELAVSLTGLRRGETRLIVGNIIGSNIINIAAGLGLVALLSNTEIPVAVLLRDGLFMFSITLVFAWLVLQSRNDTLGRWCGALLIAYTSYIALAYLA